MAIIANLRNALKGVYYSVRGPYDPLAVAEDYRKRGMKIGKGTLIYPKVSFGRGGADPIEVGKNCVLTGCTILGHDASTNRQLGLSRSMCIPVVIEDDCFIGFGAIVLMGVRVGRGSIIGAGAIVTTDVPPGSVVVGNPGRVICTVEELVKKRKQILAEHPEYIPHSSQT